MSQPQPDRPLSRARTALAVGGAAAAFALVSLATRAGSSAPASPPGWDVAGTVARHGATGIGIALAPLLLAAGAAAWLVGGTLARRRRAEEEERDPSARRRRLIRWAVFAGSLFGLLLLVRTGVLDVHRLHLRVPGSGAGGAAHSVARRGGGDQVTGADWTIAAVVWATLAVLAVVAVRRWRRPPEAVPAAARSEAGGPAAIDFAALRSAPDPRKAVIRSYAEMERSLDGRALGRDPAEGPREYLTRVSGRLRRSRAAARRLTGLYERARFSVHAVDRRMQADAVDALEAVDGDREEPA
jgi:hypothetical protein